MRTLTDGTLRVFTFKDGILSKVAHDLQLTLTRFEIRVDGEQVEATFWPASLRVDGPVQGGRLVADGLKEKDRREIHANITERILHTGRHPTARLVGAYRDGALEGALTLAGQSAAVRVPTRVEGGRLRATVELAPSRFGVAPFKALLGAIKLQDRVRVEVDLPWA